MAFQNFAPLYGDLGKRFGVNPQFLGHLVNAESSGNPLAMGPKLSRYGDQQAQGLMQLMPGTYADMAQQYGLGGDAMDPANNATAGTAYYAQMRDMFGSDADALAAYNWGPGNMKKWIAAGRDPAQMPAETRNYVSKILAGGQSSLYPGSENDGPMIQTASGPAPGARPGDATSLLPMPPGREIHPVADPMPLQQPMQPPEDATIAEAMGGDMLGGGPDDLLNPQAPAEGGMMDDFMAKLQSPAGIRALGDAGAALLAASGWSTRPITMGEALGGAMQAGRKGYDDAQSAELNKRMVEAKLKEMDANGAGMATLLGSLGVPGSTAPSVAGTGQPAAKGGPAIQTASGAPAQAAGDDTFYGSLSKPEQIQFNAALASNDRGVIANAVGSIMDQRAKAQAAAAEATAKGSKESFDQTDKLRDDFTATTAFKDYNLVAPQYNQIQKLASKANPSGTDDLAMIYALAKILDPGSAVREGEVQFSQLAMPGAEKFIRDLKGIYDEKTMLNPTIRKDIAANAAAIFNDRKVAYDATADRFKSMATEYGLNADNIVLPGLEAAPQATILPEGYTAPPDDGEAAVATPTDEPPPEAVAPELLQNTTGMTKENLAAMPLNSVVEDAQGRTLLKTDKGWLVLQRKPE